jgi:hypothetical protein
MEVQLYIKGQKIDLFEDEKISINLSIKNINDLSKVLTDFTQTFNIPATKNNNAVFEHWYNSDVDGTFNVNIRVEAYLEVNSLPFRYGSVQLDSAKLKDGLPYSYSCTFYGAGVSLSDLFGEYQLKDLVSLSDYDHTYNSTIVTNAMSDNSLFNGDVYYPMISAIDEMSLQTANARDLENASNTVSYREFKPALRNIRIIEAIESFFGITLTKDFFDRSVFYNSFLWLHKDAGYMKVYGDEQRVDLQNVGNLSDIQMTANTTTNEIEFTPYENSFFPNTNIRRSLRAQITPDAGFENVIYKLKVFRNGNLATEKELVGNGLLNWQETFNSNFFTNSVFYFTISASEPFSYKSTITGKKRTNVSFSAPTTEIKTIVNSVSSVLTSYMKMLEQMPEIKVMDYFKDLIARFNLIIKPTSPIDFYVDTLDNWYSKGKTYDLNKYIDIKDIQVKRPNVKKKIEFLYQKTDSILGKQYFENNQESYGDLKSTYNISGDDLKIESQFENMLFERLTRESSGGLTELQVGFSIDKNLKPYKGKGFMFYRNGLEVLDINTYIQPSTLKTKYWHTATEDNIDITQVTSSLNFGSDTSTYFYAPIEQSLYFNWWKNYIEDLFNKKCRVLSLSGKMPTHILYKLQMNDRFIVQDRIYKISDLKIDLTTGDFSGDVFTDFSQPADTIDNVVPLTVDSDIISVDSDLISVDTISTYEPVYSFTTNSISLDTYFATKGEEHFEVKVTANTNWSVINVDDGFGVDWFSVNKSFGNKTDFIRVKVNYNTTTNRNGILRFTIGADTFDLNIIQL